jgi:kumamolisin
VVQPDSPAEIAWDRTGGGFSEHFNLPPWQNVAGDVAGELGIAAMRGVPDVAAQESPGYSIYLDGVSLAAGGTSAVAPMWAALAARINQRSSAPIGFFSPILYGTGEKLFRDVVNGGNGRFQARAGWNPCTGLGVPDGTALDRVLRASR